MLDCISINLRKGLIRDKKARDLQCRVVLTQLKSKRLLQQKKSINKGKIQGRDVQCVWLTRD